MSTGYCQKNKDKLQLAKCIKIFLKKRKTKNINMFVKDIEILLKKKNNNRKQEYCHEHYIKQRLIEYGRNYYIKLKK